MKATLEIPGEDGPVAVKFDAGGIEGEQAYPLEIQVTTNAAIESCRLFSLDAAQRLRDFLIAVLP